MSYGTRLVRRICLFGGGLFAVVILGALFVTFESTRLAYDSASRLSALDVEPFPLGVDPANATITEQMIVESFYEQHLATADQHKSRFWNRIVSELQGYAAYQNLASPVSRIIVVWPGERTEEAAKNIGDVLRWSQADQALFTDLLAENELAFSQGFILPGQYTTHRHATPADIATLLTDRYRQDIIARYTNDIAAIVPFSDTLIVASLIEREASDFANMREVSGVIWNRLFINMPLQLDASLQYVKANDPTEPAWWPAVRPADKFIDSPFNTYQNTGLPPAPITNPSIEAIVAALNPRVTDCLYYFHSRGREYYCSVTYEEHVQKLQQVYGQGN